MRIQERGWELNRERAHWKLLESHRFLYLDLGEIHMLGGPQDEPSRAIAWASITRSSLLGQCPL